MGSKYRGCGGRGGWSDNCFAKLYGQTQRLRTDSAATGLSPARRRRNSRAYRQGARPARRRNPDPGTRSPPPLNPRQKSVLFRGQASEEVAFRSRLTSPSALGPSRRRPACRSRTARAAQGVSIGGRGRGRAAGATPTGPSCSMTADAPPGTVGCALPRAEGPRSGLAPPPEPSHSQDPSSPRSPLPGPGPSSALPDHPGERAPLRTVRGEAAGTYISDQQVPRWRPSVCVLNAKVAGARPYLHAGLSVSGVRAGVAPLAGAVLRPRASPPPSAEPGRAIWGPPRVGMAGLCPGGTGQGDHHIEVGFQGPLFPGRALTGVWACSQ